MMKVKQLIKLLEKIEPELDVYTFYDHGVVHKLGKNQIVVVDDESVDKYTPRGLIFCSHHDDDMEHIVQHRKYKSTKHHH
jgi:hypothetical protein